MAKINTAERVSRGSLRQLRIPALAARLPRRRGTHRGRRARNRNRSRIRNRSRSPEGPTVRHSRQAPSRRGSLLDRPDVEFRQAVVPPLEFPEASFDCVISFQVIEHIRDDRQFVREIHRVLRPGGRFIVTTPNAPMSLTRNPWHVREYTADELRQAPRKVVLPRSKRSVSSETSRLRPTTRKTAAAWSASRDSTPRPPAPAPPRWMLQIPYDLLNRLNRRRLLRENNDLTTSIRMEDYRLGPQPRVATTSSSSPRNSRAKRALRSHPAAPGVWFQGRFRGSPSEFGFRTFLFRFSLRRFKK